MDFYFAGGAAEVGGSCIYLRSGEYGILLDAGIRQGSGSRDVMPDFRGIQMRGGVDAILVSHAHMDHTGSLPVISKAYPNARIYMTKMTMELTRVLLYDSLKLMERREEEIPQYSQTDVQQMLHRIVPVPFQTEWEILPGVKMTAYPAGHIAGAACLQVQMPEGTVFYSGDVSGFAQQTIEGIGIPRLRPDILLLESTYGDRLHASRSIEEGRLVQTVADQIRRGHKVLIPAFALGRSQEVLLILRQAMQKGELPEVPVYVDGMIREINSVYTANPTCLRRNLARRILRGEEPFYYKEVIRPVAPREDRDLLTEKPGAAIFVASSGMLTGGPSMLYARKLLPREDACVILTGYQDEEAPGRLLLNLVKESAEEERRLQFDGVTLPVRCQVEMVGLSAHADSSELAGIVEKLGGRTVILVHGSQEAENALGKALAGDIRRRVYQPQSGEELTLTLHSRRKQEDEQERLPWTMQKTSFDPEKDPAWLWNYWTQHYPGRTFSPAQAVHLWYGRGYALSEEDTEAFVQALLESGCFSRHPKRLFLLQANTEEEMRANRKAAEPTIQDAEAAVRAIVPADMHIRKIGYYQAEKRAVVSVDFPDAVSPARLEAWSAALQEKIGWSLSLKEGTNHAAAAKLLQELYGPRIGKTSYYEDRKVYLVSLTDDAVPQEEETKKTQMFSAVTGWTLRLQGQINAAAPSLLMADLPPVQIPAEDFLWFLPDPGCERTEQNLAFSLVDMTFAEMRIRPAKKGKKNDHIGAYLELSFLTPELGERCRETLQSLAGQTGWRIHISESVNQMELMEIANALCREYQVAVSKNPSWRPKEHVLFVNNAPGTRIPEEMKEAFLERTGVRLAGLR